MTKIHTQLLLALPFLLQSVRGARVTVEQAVEQSQSANSEEGAELFDEDDAEVERPGGRAHSRPISSRPIGRPIDSRRRVPTPDTRRRRSAEDERRKYLQNCEFTEEWGPWGECSATCGGGLRTASLVARNITKPQDAYKYGKACPDATRRFEACAQDVMCSTDCSTVDLNNRLPAAGGAARWEFEAEAGQCVFQFWQVLPGDPTPRVRLLGQTLRGADLATSDGATVYEAGAPERKRFVLQMEKADIAYGDVAVGFRGCTLKPKGEAPSVAKVCIWAGEAFLPEAQTAVLDEEQQARLAAFATASRASLAAELAKRAAKTEGVGAGEEGVTFEGTGTGPGFSLQAVMAPQPPAQPIFRDATEDGDSVAVNFQLPGDNGAALEPGFKVALKRQFLQRNNDACKPVELPACGAGRPGEPCFVNSPGSSSPGVVVRNMVLASKYEVLVAVKNAAGWGDYLGLNVMTRAKSGVPASDCAVDYWTCASDGEDGTEDAFPSPDDPQCSLTAPPLPVCRQKGKEDKCDGKKYVQKCKARMKVSSSTCSVPELAAVCVHRAATTEGKPAPAKCAAAGCSKAWFFWNQKKCCCRSKADTEEDSPNCGCTTESCDKLGWVDAVNPGSCRH